MTPLRPSTIVCASMTSFGQMSFQTKAATALAPSLWNGNQALWCNHRGVAAAMKRWLTSSLRAQKRKRYLPTSTDTRVRISQSHRGTTLGNTQLQLGCGISTEPEQPFQWFSSPSASLSRLSHSFLPEDLFFCRRFFALSARNFYIFLGKSLQNVVESFFARISGLFHVQSLLNESRYVYLEDKKIPSKL